MFQQDVFWENMRKFPGFLLSVFIGFFLTAAYPILRLSKDKKILAIILVSILTVTVLFYGLIRLMLGYE
uniref:Uncharacterized protein ycf33 n=1 Tax=Yamadaella caenomyce TaxID=259029 RepID=A0A1G4NZ30_9FLOR|nr:Hypothetical protein ycf33 [Yamadaella caenomyce]SCW23874.1 Hypothetical protein ycf33 [Yamadaella caenomyce]